MTFVRTALAFLGLLLTFASEPWIKTFGVFISGISVGIWLQDSWEHFKKSESRGAGNSSCVEESSARSPAGIGGGSK